MIKELDYMQNKRELIALLTEHYIQNTNVGESNDIDIDRGTEFTKDVSLIYEEDSKTLGRLVGQIDWITFSLRIDDLHVDHSQRSKGIGGKLLKRAEDMARECGCQMSFVDTTKTTAPKFYEKTDTSVTVKYRIIPPKVMSIISTTKGSLVPVLGNYKTTEFT